MGLLPARLGDIGEVRVWLLPWPRTAVFTTAHAHRCLGSVGLMLAVTAAMLAIVADAGRGSVAGPVFWAALATSISACFATVLCDPGILPPWDGRAQKPLRVTTRAIAGTATKSSSPFEVQRHNALLADEDEAYQRDYMLPFCSACGHLRPATAVHCYVSEVCIQHLDHYCVFLGCPIAARNYRWFVLYQAAFVVADAVAQFAWIVPSFLDTMNRSGWRRSVVIVHMALIITGVPIMVGTFALCVFYILRMGCGRNSRAPAGAWPARLRWMACPPHPSLVSWEYLGALRSLPPVLAVGHVATNPDPATRSFVDVRDDASPP